MSTLPSSGGRYTFEQLCQLAEAVDAGFDRALFADMLRHIDRFDDEDFTEYGVASGAVPVLRAHVGQWRAQLGQSEAPPT